MGKIKISLANGNVIEKPLITCFQGGAGNYLVLDNETNGSMGLPIICISKYNSGKAEKIVDPNEWAAVKENLKTIIAGTALPYISVPENITASDEFYTQLTLPVASFDLIKNSYKPVETTPATEMPAIETPAPAAAEMPNVNPLEPAVPTPQVPTMEPTVISAPQPAPVGESNLASPVDITPAPVAESNPELTDIASIKENFLKSCETMFDALVKQFNK